MISVFVASARLHFATQKTSSTAILLGVAQPMILAAVLLAGGAANSGHSVSMLVGVGLTSLWGLTVWSGGNILRSEIWSGTLGRLIVAPTDIRLVVLGKAAGSATMSTVLVLTSIVVVAVIAGTRPAASDVTALALGIPLAVVSAMGLGLVLGSLFVLTRSATRIAEVLMYPVYLFGGLLLPLTFLPDWLRWPASFVSLHWVQDLVESASRADGTQSMIVDLSAAMLLTLVYLVLGWVLFDRVLRHVQCEGTVEFV